MRQGYECSRPDTSWHFCQKGSTLKKAPNLPNSTTTWGPKVQNCELWGTVHIQTTKYTLFSFFYPKTASNSPLFWGLFVTGYKVSMLWSYHCSCCSCLFVCLKHLVSSALPIFISEKMSTICVISVICHKLSVFTISFSYLFIRSFTSVKLWVVFCLSF